MLVITRKENEALVIEVDGELIEIKVTEIGSQVRLGISAPERCKIWRKELYATVQANRQATQDAGPVNLRDVAGLLKKKDSKDSE